MNIMPIRQFGKKPEKNMSEAPLIITKGGKKAFVILPYKDSISINDDERLFYSDGSLVPTPKEIEEPLLTKDEIWYNKLMFTNRFKVLVSIIFLFAALSLFTLVFVTLSQRVNTALNYSRQAYSNSIETLKIVKSFPTTAPTATPEAVLKTQTKSTNLIITKTPIK